MYKVYNQSCLIHFKPIDCETANGEVTQYIIEYRTQGSLYPPFVTSTSFLYRTLTGLQVLTDYEVNVTAQTGGGRGQLSATVTAYTCKCYYSHTSTMLISKSLYANMPIRLINMYTLIA